MTFNVGMKIKQKRKEHHLTQKEIADKLGVSRQTISKWENDRSLPDIHSLLQFCEIFGTSLDELLRKDSNERGKKVAEMKKKLALQKKIIYLLSCATVVSCMLLVSQQKQERMVPATQEEQTGSLYVEVHSRSGEKVMSGNLDNVKNSLDFAEVQDKAFVLIQKELNLEFTQ